MSVGPCKTSKSQRKTTKIRKGSQLCAAHRAREKDGRLHRSRRGGGCDGGRGGGERERGRGKLLARGGEGAGGGVRLSSLRGGRTATK
jgi:hypothetical protein